MSRLMRAAREYRDAYFESEIWQRTSWMGRAIVKSPLDCWMYQEVIHDTRPDVLVECGTRFGGSALFFAHLFDILDHGEVITIDLEPPQQIHERVTCIQGNVLDNQVLGQVAQAVRGRRTMVSLDDCHEPDHISLELSLYGPFVSSRCFLVVEDTFWLKAERAVVSFLQENPEFEQVVDKFPGGFVGSGWLRRK